MNALMMNRIVSIAAMLLIALPVGIACIVLGFGMGDTPCILCWQERTAMVLTALVAVFIMRYGLKPKYIGALLFTAIYGLWAGYRHSSPHILRDIGQGFGPAILGIHTYVWVMVVFAVVLLFAALMLVMQGDKLVEQDKDTKWSLLNKTTINVFLVVIAFNIVQAFTQTGPFPFIGQSDPVRMSFDPDKIIWSTGNWPTLSKLSARGSYSIEKPDFSQTEVNQATMLAAKNQLALASSVTLPAAIEGVVSGISYNPNSKMYAAVTTDNWVYFIDQSLTNVLAQVRIDAAFSVEISNLADVVFDGDNSVFVTADHKSFARVAYDPQAKIADYYANFMAGTDGVKELKRSRITTARARYNYIASAAWDPIKQEYLMVTLPDAKQPNFVLVRVSGEDYQLNSEAKIKLATQALPMVTAMVVDGDKAYLLSNSAKQVLVMDLATNQVEYSLDISDVVNPQAMTLVNGQLAIVDAQAANNQVKMFSL